MKEQVRRILSLLLWREIPVDGDISMDNSEYLDLISSVF